MTVLLTVFAGMMSPFRPTDLGVKTRAWWAPPHTGNITLNGSGISGWRDETAAYLLSQSTGSSQPAYDPTGYDGQSCGVFDGVDDYLTLSPAPATFPAGSSTSGVGEIWVCCRQDAPASSAGQRAAFSYGVATGGNLQRVVRREVVGGVNRALAAGVNQSVANTSVDFSGAHVLRVVYSTSAVRVDVDGVAGAPSGVPSLLTALTNVRMGANPAATPAQHWQGAIRQAAVTSPLTDEEAAAMYAFMNEGA